MKRILPLILLITLLSGCSWFDFTSKNKLTLKSNDKDVALTIEVADSEEEREQGLMGREKLDDGTGMWFVFEDEKVQYFWMKNMKISIDIIFLDKDKKAVKFYENLKPCAMEKCPSYSSISPAMYALEVPAGFAQLHAVKVGDEAK